MDKNTVRKKMLEQRNRLTRDQITEGGEIIKNLLMKNPIWIDKQVVYLYASFGSEVSTKAIFEYCVKEGKKTAFPRVANSKNMDFYEVKDFNQLKAGFHGIYEPEENCKEIKEPGLMILPGLAFDKKGNRLGYGAGYYDRYLCRHPHHKTVGIAYDFQMVETLYPEMTDVPVNEVLHISLPS
ncbi:MAG: 5-formyltetrahydrofolate cyclo-ligase [Acetivibrio sp.]